MCYRRVRQMLNSTGVGLSSMNRTGLVAIGVLRVVWMLTLLDRDCGEGSQGSVRSHRWSEEVYHAGLSACMIMLNPMS